MMDSFRGILSSAPEVMSLLSHSRFWQRCDVVAWEAIHRLHVESTVSFQSVTVSIRTIYTLYEHIGFMLFFVLLPFWLLGSFDLQCGCVLQQFNHILLMMCPAHMAKIIFQPLVLFT
jgi:hypothetical protein